MFEEHGSMSGWMGYGWAPGGDAGAEVQALTQQEHAFLRLPPELFFASELFQGRYVRRRQRVRDYEVRSTCSARTLRYTGERLDQFDLDVFLACALHAPEQRTTAPMLLKMDLRGVARTVLRNTGAAALERIAGALRRLESARVEVRDVRFACYLQPFQKVLLDTMEHRCLIELNPDMLRSLQRIRNFHGFIRDRFRLRKCSMDRWLHGLLHYSAGVCIPFGGVAELSGNADAQPARVGEALDRLRNVVRPDEIGIWEGGGLEIRSDAPASGGQR